MIEYLIYFSCIFLACLFVYYDLKQRRKKTKEYNEDGTLKKYKIKNGIFIININYLIIILFVLSFSFFGLAFYKPEIMESFLGISTIQTKDTDSFNKEEINCMLNYDKCE